MSVRIIVLMLHGLLCTTIFLTIEKLLIKVQTIIHCLCFHSWYLFTLGLGRFLWNT